MRMGRVYQEPSAAQRVLVDRLWPRGMRKDDPRVGRWMPDVAPSTALRRWYGHDRARAEEFVHRYRQELAEPASAAALAELREVVHRAADDGVELELVTATKEVASSHLPVLAELLAPGADLPGESP